MLSVAGFALGQLVLAGCGGEPPADARIVAVTSLGRMEKPGSIQGRDGGVSGRFAGRSVWVYGDSVATEAGTFPTTWRNNTMSSTLDLDASDGIQGFVQPTDALGAAREFFPRTPEEQAYNDAHVDRGDGACADPCGARFAIWGGGPVEDLDRGRALVTYGKVRAAPGDFNFRILGTSIAVWEDFDAGPTRPHVTSKTGDPTLLFDGPTEGEFGVGATLSEGRLYLFSCSGGPTGSHACRLTRAPIDDILARDAWEFWGGDAWTPDVAAAAALFDGSPNMSVHHSAKLDRFLAVYIDGGTLRLRTARVLEGPWSAPLDVFTPPEDNAMHGQAHAEYQEGGGAVEYVSYLADDFRLLRVELDQR